MQELRAHNPAWIPGPPAGLQALNMALIAFTIFVAFLRPDTGNFSPFVPPEYAAVGGGAAAVITGAANVFFIYAGSGCPPSASPLLCCQGPWLR